jgi:hypothetical protein
MADFKVSTLCKWHFMYMLPRVSQNPLCRGYIKDPVKHYFVYSQYANWIHPATILELIAPTASVTTVLPTVSNKN